MWPRQGVVALLTAVLLGTAVGAAPHAAAAPRCAVGTGVTVVVDYGGLKGGTKIGCDPDGAGRRGSDVVPAAGFPLEYVTNEPGFVCSISNKPDPVKSCHRTPPASAFWGLYWSDGSGGWNWSSSGIAELKVPEGGSIGWRWQDGGARDLPRAAPTTVNSSPSPSPKPSSAPRPSPSVRPTEATSPATRTPASTAARTPGVDGAPAGAAGENSRPGGTDKSEPATAKSKQAKSAKERRRAEDGRKDKDSQDTRRSISTSADEVYEVKEPVTEPLEPASSSEGGGSPAGTVAALVLLAGLGTAAALIARRRRVG
jgi:hypothetical protein